MQVSSGQRTGLQVFCVQTDCRDFSDVFVFDWTFRRIVPSAPSIDVVRSMVLSTMETLKPVGFTASSSD